MKIPIPKRVKESKSVTIVIKGVVFVSIAQMNTRKHTAAAVCIHINLLEICFSGSFFGWSCVKRPITPRKTEQAMALVATIGTASEKVK